MLHLSATAAAVSDCSSAEEDHRERVARTQQRATRRHSNQSSSSTPAESSSAAAAAASTSYTATPPVDLNGDQRVTRMIQSSSLPVVKPMDQMLTDCVYMNADVNGLPYCKQQHKQFMKDPTAAAAAASSLAYNRTTPASAVKVEENAPKYDLNQAFAAAMATKQGPSLTDTTWVKFEWDKRRDAVALPAFYVEMNMSSQPAQAQVHHMLSTAQVLLPIQTATLESCLLAEAGTFVTESKKVYTFPPCRNGAASCVSMKPEWYIRNQTRPVLLTMVMFEPEYKALLTHGQAPKASRPCVRCARHYFAGWVCYDRNIQMSGDATTGQDGVLPFKRDGIVAPRQFYSNLHNQTEGYVGQHMLVFNHTPNDPVYDPMCMGGRMSMIAVDSTTLFHEASGRPRFLIDQTAMIYKEPIKPTPDPGTNLMLF